MSWDQLFMGMAYLTSAKSHDPRTRVGSVIATEDNMIVSVGYNGLPRGVAYSTAILSTERKYDVMAHAEENAILNSNRTAQSLIDCKLYVNLLPCNVCARLIIQSGIKEVVVDQNSQKFYIETSEKGENYWEESFKITKSLFSETGVKLRFLDYQPVILGGLFNGENY